MHKSLHALFKIPRLYKVYMECTDLYSTLYLAEDFFYRWWEGTVPGGDQEGEAVTLSVPPPNLAWNCAIRFWDCQGLSSFCCREGMTAMSLVQVLNIESILGLLCFALYLFLCNFTSSVFRLKMVPAFVQQCPIKSLFCATTTIWANFAFAR